MLPYWYSSVTDGVTIATKFVTRVVDNYNYSVTIHGYYVTSCVPMLKNVLPVVLR